MQSRRPSIHSLTLEQVIDPDPLTVTPDTSVLEVINQMSQVRGSGCQLSNPNSITHLDVSPLTTSSSKSRASCALVMEQERLVGLFTERDLVRLAASLNSIDAAKIGDVMTHSVVSLSSSEAQNIFVILSTFRQHRIRHLPILNDEGQVVGVVTPGSIRSALQPLNFLRLKQVADVMTTDVVQAPTSASVLEIAQLMSEHRVSCVVITEAGTGQDQPPVPVGIITERDIVQFQALGLSLAHIQAQAVMSTPLFPIKPQDSLWSAHQQMLSRHLRRLVVTGDGGELLGIITQSNVLQVLDPVELVSDLEQLQQVLDSQTLELQHTNQQLHEEITQRQGLEAALQETNAALEQKVGRTQAQLVKTNASLRESEARYRQLFESNPHPMWVYDIQTLAFLAVNEAAIAHYGYSRAEFLGMTIRDIRPPQTVPALEENIAKVTSGLDEAGIWQHLKKDGTAIAVEITSHTLIWQGRRAEVVLANDVTEQVQAEAALRQKTQILERYSSSLEKLHRISTTNYQNFDVLFADYLEVGCEILGMSTGIISSISNQTYTIRAVRSNIDSLVPGAELALGDTYCAAVVAGSQTLAYTHVGEIPTMQSHPVYQNLQLESYIGTPIYVEGQIYGTLNFSAPEVRTDFKPYEREIVELMAQSLGRLIAADRLERKRQQAEQETKEALKLAQNSETRLRAITANAPVYICELDRQGQILFANRTYEGVTQAQVIGTLLTDWFPQEQRPTITSVVEQAFRSQQVQEVEYAIPDPQGEIRSYVTQIAPILTNNRAASAVLIAADITERKWAEQELESFFSLSLDLLCIAGLDGYFKRLNPAFEQMLGWSDQKLRSQPFLEFVHPDDRAATTAAVGQLARGDRVVAFENRYRTANGDYRWLLWSAAPFQSEQLIYAVARDITERKQVEQALKQERDFTAAVLNTVGTLVVVLDRKGQIVRFNRTCEAVTGYSFREVRGKKVWDFLLFPEEKPLVQAVFERLLAGQFQNHYENTWVSKEGERRLISWSNTALMDEQGSVNYVIAAGIDLTERRLAQEKLERSYRQAQLLAQVTRQIRQSLELEDILQTTVTEVQNLLGCDRVLIYQVFPDGTGKTISEVVLPEYSPILGTTFSEAVFPQESQEQYRQGRVRAIADVHAPEANLPECLIQFVDQWSVKAKLVVPILQNLSASESSTPLEGDPSGTAQNELWGLLVAHQCSSPRQWETLEIDLLRQLGDQIGVALSQAQLLARLEERVAQRTAELLKANLKLQNEVTIRARTEQALRRSETELRLITDALPVLISYVDAQQRYRFVNQTYEEWFGQPRFRIIGRSIREVLGEEIYQQIQPYVNTVLSGQPVIFEIEVAFKNGDRWVSGTYVPDFGELGEVKGFFALISDISELKAVQQLKSEFISIVSHELRTPLTSIHGSLKLLSTGRLGKLTEPGQEMLNIALKNTDRLTRLVSDILDLERIESGKVAIAPQICDACDLLVQAVEAMTGMAQAEGITLSSTPVSTQVWADPDSVIQTLTNLISNAIKFSLPGSTVWLTAADQGQEVLFQVKDQGRGIPADKLEKIFERFQQVDASDSRSKGGTGLGLAICQEIIRRHGGRIWAQSQLGEGSTFCFTLPTAKPEE